MTLRRLTCRHLQVRFPKPRTTEEREYYLNWRASELRDDPWADSRDEDRDGNAELGELP